METDFKSITTTAVINYIHLNPISISNVYNCILYFKLFNDILNTFFLVLDIFVFLHKTPLVSYRHKKIYLKPNKS